MINMWLLKFHGLYKLYTQDLHHH